MQGGGGLNRGRGLISFFMSETGWGLLEGRLRRKGLNRANMVSEKYFSNSLLITHYVKTKKIVSVTEVWITSLN